MEQAIMEYLANASWQLPLLAAGAWLLLRITKLHPQIQHRVWLAVLVFAMALPLQGGKANSIDAQTGQSNVAVKTIASGALTTVEVPAGLVVGPKIWSDSDSLKAKRDEAGFSYFFASHVRRISISAEAVNWIFALYIGTLLIALLRLILAWIATQRLTQHSRLADLTGQQLALVKECAGRMEVALPHIRESASIAGPVVIGAVKPVLLWPEALGNLCHMSAASSTDEIKAALCHEFAHIRRHDYLANLLCEVVSIPLKWHPVMFGVERRVRSTREMACDALAAGAMESETKYAECLLSLAQRMVGAGKLHEGAAFVGAGLFTGNALEERVMRLMGEKKATNSRVKIARGFVGAAAMMATALLAVSFHLVPAMAQETVQPGPVVEPTSVAPAASISSVAEPAAVPMQIRLPKRSLAPVITLTLIVPQAAPAPAASITPQPAPVPVSQAAAPQAAPLAEPTTPAPDANSAAPSSTSATDNRDRIIINDLGHKLTPKERQRIQKQLEDAQRQIAAEEKRFNSPEFRKQIAEAERQAMEASRKVQSGEMQQQLAEAQKEIAAQTARLNSPEFKKQLEDAQRYANEESQKIDSAELQKQLAEAQRQIAASTEKLNSPEFKKQIENAVRQAQQANRIVDSAQIQKQLDEAQKQIADQLEKMKVEDGDEAK